MKSLRTVLVVLVVLGCCVSIAAAEQIDRTIYQVSTMKALKAGVFDGTVTIKDLKKHGNVGLGTLNGLDGELIAVDGEFYQVAVDGTVRIVKDDEKVPFAIVAEFSLKRGILLAGAKDKKQLEQRLDALTPDLEIPSVIVLDGKFRAITVRSVPAQRKPYPALSKALEGQKKFELKDISGTVVGFRFPDYVGEINHPGYHFHFLSKDKKKGGHVLEVEAAGIMVKIQPASGLFVKFPPKVSECGGEEKAGSDVAASKREKGKEWVNAEDGNKLPRTMKIPVRLLQPRISFGPGR